MTQVYPMHPDDEKMLLPIRRYLIGYRITNGWTQADLGKKLGGGVFTLESGDFNWHLSRLQQWVLPFGMRLVATPLFDQHETFQADPRVSPLWDLANNSPQWPMWQRAYLTSYLKVAREMQGISPQQLGNKLGITAKALRNWEAEADDVMLAKILSHARALGGRIHMEVVDA